MTDDRANETRRVMAYLSVYQTSRQYGGPEEGGWWYDTYELEAAAPFLADQTYIFDADLAERRGGSGWRPIGKPVAIDRAWIDGEILRLKDLYGIDERRPGQGGFVIVGEVHRGHLAERPAPRYE